MLYKSDSFEVAFIKDNIAEFKFCADGSVNKLSQQTLQDCALALKRIGNKLRYQRHGVHQR